MSDIRTIVTTEIQRLSDELGQKPGWFGRSRQLKRLLERKDLINIITEQVRALHSQELATEAIQQTRDERARQRELRAKQAETARREEDLKQKRFEDEEKQLEFNDKERLNKLGLMNAAAQFGLDVPTYLEVAKALLIQAPNSELKTKMDEFKKKLEAERLQPLLLNGILRGKLRELRTELHYLKESEPDGPLKDELIADIEKEIKACEAQQKGYENEMGKKGGRKQVVGGAEPDTVPEPPILGHTDRK